MTMGGSRRKENSLPAASSPCQPGEGHLAAQGSCSLSPVPKSSCHRPERQRWRVHRQFRTPPPFCHNFWIRPSTSRQTSLDKAKTQIGVVRVPRPSRRQKTIWATPFWKRINVQRQRGLWGAFITEGSRFNFDIYIFCPSLRQRKKLLIYISTVFVICEFCKEIYFSRKAAAGPSLNPAVHCMPRGTR